MRGIAQSQYVKLKAEAFDPDGSITEVRFYGQWRGDGGNRRVLGVVTNAPYNVLWDSSAPGGIFTVSAVARDDSGAETESEPVVDYLYMDPPTPDVLLSPANGTIVPARTDFEFSVERVVTAITRGWPITLLFDHQEFPRVFPTMTATSPPVAVTITNITAGEHTIGFIYDETSPCYCPPHTITAVNLAMKGPVRAAAGALSFELITAFPGRATALESSGDLAAWTEARVVTPDQNYYRTSVAIEPNGGRRFYRARLVEEPAR